MKNKYPSSSEINKQL